MFEVEVVIFFVYDHVLQQCVIQVDRPATAGTNHLYMVLPVAKESILQFVSVDLDGGMENLCLHQYTHGVVHRCPRDMVVLAPFQQVTCGEQPLLLTNMFQQSLPLG